MKEFNKHAFDEIFRTGLSAPDLNEVDEDWELMKALLQNAESRPLVPYYLIFVSSVAALLLMVFSVVFNSEETIKNPLAKIESNSQKPALSAKAPVNNKLVSPSFPETAKYEGAKETTRIPESIYFSRLSILNEQNEPTLNESLLDLANITSSFPADSSLSSIPNVQSLNSKSLNEEIIKASSISTDAENKSDEVNGSTDLMETNDKSNPSKNRLSLAINFAPDLNGVEQFQSNKISYSVGAGLIYNISNKLSIEAGAAYGRKSYQTGFSSFRPASYRMFQVKANMVSSGFDVMDIQLNLAYTLLKKGKSSFGVGAGISSYLMLDEQYSFTYSNIYARGLSSFNTGYQNNHFLGIANLNFSFKRNLSNNVKLAFNPYLKLPLTDLGYGNIRLRSAGVSVGIITNLNKSKK